MTRIWYFSSGAPFLPRPEAGLVNWAEEERKSSDCVCLTRMSSGNIVCDEVISRLYEENTNTSTILLSCKTRTSLREI